MYYTGIDLHKKTSFITTIDARRKIVRRANLQNVEDDILAYFAALDKETKIVIESMSSWYWLYDLLTGEGFELLISNPVKTKAVASAKIKNFWQLVTTSCNWNLSTKITEIRVFSA